MTTRWTWMGGALVALLLGGCSGSPDPTPDETGATTTPGAGATASPAVSTGDTSPQVTSPRATPTPPAPSASEGPGGETPTAAPIPTPSVAPASPGESPTPAPPSASPSPSARPGPTPSPTATLPLLCPLPTDAPEATEGPEHEGDDEGERRAAPREEAPTPPFGLAVREANRGCRVTRFEEPPSPWELVEAFPDLRFTEPVFITHAGDGTSRLYVLERAGRVLTFDDDPQVTEATTFLDIRGEVNLLQREMGLLGLAFHPDYAANGALFIHYTAGDPYRIVISRLRRDPDDPTRVAPGSEEVLLEIPLMHYAHNGGTLAFGPDGYLYISVGDGGGQSDLHQNGQNPYTLQGVILRIDVDHQDPDKAYAVPPSNPFADGVGGAPEVWAWGFRNPYRMAFDGADLWVGEVGQYTWEEIDLVRGGLNYGWPVMEGFACWQPRTGCNPAGKELPILAYSHDVGQAIIGGFVYRGARFPELQGAYLYGDFGGGQVWALGYEPGQAAEGDLLVDTELPISALGQSAAGEAFVLDYTGRILTLAKGDPAEPEGVFPRTLSETGCFDDVAARVPAAGVIPYTVSSPLWSDGAIKARWMALPGCDGRVGFTEVDPWALPDGALLFKDFAIDEVKGDEIRRRLLETRMLVHLNGAWRGYSYRWNEDQTDAVLLDDGAQEEVTGYGADGVLRTFTYGWPSRDACARCHTAAAGDALGLHTGAFNTAQTYGGIVDNQLRALDHVGIFDPPLSAPPEALAAYVDPAEPSATLAQRARSYLAANCAHCHRPGTNTRANLDLRYETALSKTGACNAAPYVGDLGVEGAKILTPGDPSLSVLSLRMHTLTGDRMPPLASGVVDPLGVDVVDRWITSLTSCAGP